MKRLLAIATDGCRTAVLTTGSFTVDHFMSEFGRHVDPPFELGQRFSCQILIGQRSINDSCVEERYTTLYRLMQQTDTLFFVGMLAAVVGHSHHAETECRHLEGRFARTQYTMSLDADSIGIDI